MAKKKASTSASGTKTTKKVTPSRAGAASKKTTKKPAAKKSVAKKTVTKKTARKTSTKGSAAKATTNKAPTNNTPTKKSTTKKSTTKSTKKTASKTTTKKKVAKKTAKKPAAASKGTATASRSTKSGGKSGSTAGTKPTAKKAATKPASKTSTRKAPESKAGAKPSAGKAASSSATDAKPASASSTGAASTDDKKAGRKGITIVENRPKRKSSAKPKIKPPEGTLGALLAKRRRQPLIPSGPDAPPSPHSAFGEDETDAKSKRKPKSPFKKKEIDAFREKLLEKRRELAGDVANMESGMASRGDRGGNPALDVAEQGSDAYDQSLSIGFAEADRKIIREIDEALKRIDDGIYGLCEMTQKPIGIERLNQLPWARLSIEAAREIERRGGVR